tara:strand:- start:3142 stop:3885 length:744 start_codon:yes stop_codon:yes gene_type:complete
MNSRIFFYLVKLPKTAILIFFVFVIIAGVLHPGEQNDKINFESEHYSITHNFLSQLGSVEVAFHNEINGDYKVSNLPSLLLFASAVSLIGFSMVMFYLNFEKLFLVVGDTKKALKFSKFTKPIGVVAGVMFAGVGLVPHDFNFYLHIFFAHGAFLMLWVVSILHLCAIHNSKFIAIKYSIGYIVFCVLLFFYLLLIFFGPKVGPHIMYLEKDLVLQVVSQKFIVLAFIFSILIQIFGLNKILKTSKK